MPCQRTRSVRGRVMPAPSGRKDPFIFIGTQRSAVPQLAAPERGSGTGSDPGYYGGIPHHEGGQTLAAEQPPSSETPI